MQGGPNTKRQLSDGVERMPRRMTRQEKRADTVYLYLQLSSHLFFILTALVGYWVHGLYAAFAGAGAGYLFGIWMRRSMGIRGPNPEEGWFRRMRERAEGSPRGYLEWLIEKIRANEFTREKCKAICQVSDEAMDALKTCSTQTDREAILKRLDQQIKSISYSNH